MLAQEICQLTFPFSLHLKCKYVCMCGVMNSAMWILMNFTCLFFCLLMSF
jgi:hypothetical protein